MTATQRLDSLEKSAYRRSFSDGIIDLFFGLSLLFIGIVWLWNPDLGGLAGILPAALAPLVIPIRKQFVEPRVGYVRWGQPRRHSERRRLLLMLGAGVLMFLAVGLIIASRASVPETVAPALIAWLLAILSLGLAMIMDAWRFVAYASVLALAGLVTGLQDANPGWPVLAAGVVAVAIGVGLLVAFTRANPVPEDE